MPKRHWAIEAVSVDWGTEGLRFEICSTDRSASLNCCRKVVVLRDSIGRHGTGFWAVSRPKRREGRVSEGLGCCQAFVGVAIGLGIPPLVGYTLKIMALLNTNMNSRFPNFYKPSMVSFVTSSEKLICMPESATPYF
ncbi:MAG: hypothetical protein WBA89_24840 [Microcoleus sp.]|uniref:hypothetical protein n=1 Tax=Microcoleus sp. TaxID=44472 RepID=UPI003C759B04